MGFKKRMRFYLKQREYYPPLWYVCPSGDSPDRFDMSMSEREFSEMNVKYSSLIKLISDRPYNRDNIHDVFAMMTALESMYYMDANV